MSSLHQWCHYLTRVPIHSTRGCCLACIAANCELRTVVLSDSGSEGGLDPTWFHPDDLHKEQAVQNAAAEGVLQPAANGAQ
jgi:hypothetical protein